MAVAAATVLYKPDEALVAALLEPLCRDGLPLFVFLNGPVAPEIETRLTGARATILRSDVNLGLGHGLNAVTQAAASAGFSFVLLFDQDSTPPPGLANALVAAFGRIDTPVAALGPKLVAPPGEHYLAPWLSRRGPAGRDTTPVDFLATSGTLISLAAWREIGSFRADYFIDGIDVEWCFRAWSRGYGCHLAETVEMPHRWGDATAQADRKPQILRQPLARSYYYLRNGIASLKLRHMPIAWRLRSALRLCAQAALLLAARPLHGRRWKIVLAALRDGLGSRLGPIPPGLL